MPNWNCTFQNAGKQMASLKSTYCELLNLKVTFTNLQGFFPNVLSSSALSFFSIGK